MGSSRYNHLAILWWKHVSETDATLTFFSRITSIRALTINKPAAANIIKATALLPPLLSNKAAPLIKPLDSITNAKQINLLLIIELITMQLQNMQKVR